MIGFGGHSKRDFFQIEPLKTFASSHSANLIYYRAITIISTKFNFLTGFDSSQGPKE
jgi:hypothetical protein